jgi:hypothetical protein
MADIITNDALRQDYDGPVGRLLTVGETNLFKRGEWPNYPREYELGREHIPALIRMACDVALHDGDSEGPEIWAPVHAWRALAQLRATEAVEPLLEFTKLDMDDDAVSQEFAMVFGMIGPSAIAPIAAFLRDRSLPWMAASLATGGLAEVVKNHPECRDECVGMLTGLLDRATDRDPTANGFVVCSLLDLKAVEAIDAIREAFRLDAVDISIAGDLEDVEIDLGFRERRSTRRPYYPFLSEKFTSTLASSRPDFADICHEIDDWSRPVKIGRNEPCPCGSGRKYKKCCLV